MTISGCGTVEQRQTDQLIAAATIQGQLAARPVAPKKPAECERHMERVNPKVGDKNRSIQYRWLYNADLIDAQIDRCNRFMDDWAEKVTR